MSKVIVVGTLAFDTIETPFGKVERVIGGSAPFAGLAAKTKDVECAIISIVGIDFPQSYLDILSSKMIDIFIENLEDLKKAIENEDEKKLEKIFNTTKKIRKEIIEAGQDVKKPDFGRK